MEVGGFRDDRMFVVIEDWMFGFVGSICDEEQEFESMISGEEKNWIATKRWERITGKS